MTARIALLMVAVVALAACESTKAVDTTPVKPVAVATQTQDTAPRIVRSPVVADDEDMVAVSTPTKKRVHTASLDSSSGTSTEAVETEEPAAPVSKPEKPSKPAKTETADKADPVTTADASTPTPPAAPGDSGPAPTDTAPDTSATPTADATPAADGTTPKSMFSDPSSLLQAQVGGFPVWMVALAGIVVLAALVIGLGGRKKSEEVV
jgi:hypothetical protein